MGATALYLALLVGLCGVLHSPSDGERILCVSHQFGSHMFMLHSVTESLLERGHEVYTVYSDRMPVHGGLEENGLKVLKYHTPDNGKIMTSDEGTQMIIDGVLGKIRPENYVTHFSLAALHECQDMDNDVEFTKTLLDLKFDLAVIDIFRLSTCLPFMALKLNIPFVLVPSTLDIEKMRSPFLPSFMPSEMAPLTDVMSFPERLVNLYLTLLMNCPEVNRFPSRLDHRLLYKYNKDPFVTSWDILARKAELFFISRGPVLEYAFPTTPNVITLECLTCKPGDDLPESIESIIVNYEGVIVVSFGSLVDDLPDDLTAKFVDAFSQRKELVFWRFKGKMPASVPDNVKVLKWLPQNDLLAHPKTKLFITHSGNNGQYESVYHGVPMLAFPLFAEQPHNAERIVKHGYGLKADIKTFTTEGLARDMAEIIGNSSFRERTEKAGLILRSTDMDAQERAVYWIEHVLEFGSDHLKSHALKMPWYSYYMLDMILFVQAILVIFVLIVMCTCRLILKKVFNSKAKEKQN